MNNLLIGGINLNPQNTKSFRQEQQNANSSSI